MFMVRILTGKLSGVLSEEYTVDREILTDCWSSQRLINMRETGLKWWKIGSEKERELGEKIPHNFTEDNKITRDLYRCKWELIDPYDDYFSFS